MGGRVQKSYEKKREKEKVFEVRKDGEKRSSRGNQTIQTGGSFFK